MYAYYIFRLNENGIDYPDLYFLERHDYTGNKEIDTFLRKLLQFHRSPYVKYFYHLVNPMTCFVFFV